MWGRSASLTTFVYLYSLPGYNPCLTRADNLKYTINFLRHFIKHLPYELKKQKLNEAMLCFLPIEL